MNQTENKLKTHVFVCTNKKANGASCEPRGGQEIRKQLKEWTATHPEWRGRIRINNSGCLDHCEHGVAITIYPQQETLIDVAIEDLNALKDKITKMMNG